MPPLLMTVIYHSKDAGVRCEVNPRLKSISASIVTSAGDTTVHTVLISDGSYRTACSHILFEVECFTEQHKTTISVSNTTFDMQVQGLLSSGSYTCCVLAFYGVESVDGGPSDLKRICTTFQTPNSSIQTQNGECSGSIPDEISATDCNSMNFSASVCKTGFGVLGLIISILLLLHIKKGIL